jgi:hypothetical protein
MSAPFTGREEELDREPRGVARSDHVVGEVTLILRLEVHRQSAEPAAPFLDEDGAEAVRDLTAACGAAGLPVVFAEAASGVLERMSAVGVVVSGREFPTVDEACANAIAKAEAGAAIGPAVLTPPG